MEGAAEEGVDLGSICTAYKACSAVGGALEVAEVVTEIDGEVDSKAGEEGCSEEIAGEVEEADTEVVLPETVIGVEAAAADDDDEDEAAESTDAEDWDSEASRTAAARAADKGEEEPVDVVLVAETVKGPPEEKEVSGEAKNCWDAGVEEAENTICSFGVGEGITRGAGMCLWDGWSACACESSDGLAIVTEEAPATESAGWLDEGSKVEEAEEAEEADTTASGKSLAGIRGEGRGLSTEEVEDDASESVLVLTVKCAPGRSMGSFTSNQILRNSCPRSIPANVAQYYTHTPCTVRAL